MANEDKATRYHRLQRRASVAGTVLSATFLVLLLVTHGSAWLRGAALAAGGGSFYVALVIYVAALAILHELIQLPLSFFQGVTLEKRYGLSTETVAHWWKDQAKAWLVGVALAIPAGLLVFVLLRNAPEYWWLIAAVSFAALMIGLAQLAPVLLLPIFYEIRPLQRPALVARLLSLAERAGAPVLGVYEWRLSERTRKANAALTGIGATRRILLSDTLLAEHSDDEIEVILAHELAHHVHRDIWSGIAFETALIVLGFYAADKALDAMALSFGLTGKADIAALPLLILTTAAVSLALLPCAHALSRAHERRADRYALRMTGNATAFISAMKRLGAQNLAEERPSKLVEVLFHSHPPISARIEAAQKWRA